MKKTKAGQKAVNMRELTDKETVVVSGGASYVPTVPGADAEIFPGFYGEPYEPTMPGTGQIHTLGINES